MKGMFTKGGEVVGMSAQLGNGELMCLEEVICAGYCESLLLLTMLLLCL